MPNIKAAEKWMRQTEKRTTRNKDTKTRLKTIYKKAVATGDAEAGRDVESAFDRAANKGVIHPNKAARKKSRLAAAIKRVAAMTPAKPTRTKAKAKTGSEEKENRELSSRFFFYPHSLFRRRVDEREIFLATMARELHRAGMATDAIELTLTDLARSIGLSVQIFALLDVYYDRGRPDVGTASRDDAPRAWARKFAQDRAPQRYLRRSARR